MFLASAYIDSKVASSEFIFIVIFVSLFLVYSPLCSGSVQLVVLFLHSSAAGAVPACFSCFWTSCLSCELFHLPAVSYARYGLQVLFYQHGQLFHHFW
jgi:hypothetical protein